jgi:hypothetical protein
MSQAALLLAVLGLSLGLWPLHPHGSAMGLFAAALGIVPALCALAMALSERSRALREQRPLGLPTAALGLSVAATLYCGFWLLAVLGLYLHSRHI